MFRDVSMNRREFLGIGAGAMAACSRPRQGGERQPNIVWIMLDDMGYADAGCYGSEKIRTPEIDKLATESLKFTDCYAGATVCAPSRSVLMTGLHTGHSSVRA
ncbi:MAG: sulfatase-like hydrolase/transferase, partial [bacterium]|nr:sulfatase-like hydrolase/transferase [bacterium]